MSIFNTIGTAVRASRATGSRQAEIERLHALSDSELARRGLSRDRIVHHVYRDILGL